MGGSGVRIVLKPPITTNSLEENRHDATSREGACLQACRFARPGAGRLSVTKTTTATQMTREQEHEASRLQRPPKARSTYQPTLHKQAGRYYITLATTRYGAPGEGSAPPGTPPLPKVNNEENGTSIVDGHQPPAPEVT